ncbi:MFS transporter [Fluviispira multicolorata]|uniref:MFS transporter n=1 Tax=Fluviispira multicolorata TaxID=2654512 RepID=A0A833N6I0_9BACT|nr:MFS transporter [Fluviispira multicolorata]KAB8033490.1 MFS transporter [Fluviispira multicolorata]
MPQIIDTQQMNSLRKKVLCSVFLIIFIDLLGFGMFIPIMPLIARSFQASDTQATLLSTWFSLATVLSVVFIGHLSDIYGRKKILVSTIVISAIAQILTGYSTSYLFLVFARILAGFASGNLSAAQACIADITERNNRAKYMVIIGLAFGGGFSIGPAIGTLVIFLCDTFSLFEGNYFKAIGIAAAAFNIINLVLLLKLQPETHPKYAKDQIKNLIEIIHINSSLENIKEEKTATLVQNLRHFSGNRAFVGVMVSVFLQIFAFAGVETLLPILLSDAYYFSESFIYKSYIFIGIISLLGNAFLARFLLKRLGEVYTLQIGQLSIIIGIILIPLVAPNPYVLFSGLTFLCIGTSTSNPSINALVSRLSPSTAQGFAFGCSQTVAAIARMIGPAFMGIAYETGFYISYLKGEKSLYISAFILLTGVIVSYEALRKIRVTYVFPKENKI